MMMNESKDLMPCKEIKTEKKCPVCDKDNLKLCYIEEAFYFMGHKLTVPNYEIYKCDSCDSELVTTFTMQTTEDMLTKFRECVIQRKDLTITQLERMQKEHELDSIARERFKCIGNFATTTMKIEEFKFDK
jgi:hypothetical protein